MGHRNVRAFRIFAVMLFCIALVGVGIYYYIAIYRPSSEKGDTSSSGFDDGICIPEDERTDESKEKYIVVFLCGAVENEDVYILYEGSRLYEAIREAGGFLYNADTAYHNLARELKDGERIYIPTVEETYDRSLNEKIKDVESVYTDKKQDDRMVSGLKSSEVCVNLNTAEETELILLPGIGQSRARKIIEYRNKVGRFDTIEEIMNVSGIGNAMFEQMKDNLCVE